MFLGLFSTVQTESAFHPATETWGSVQEPRQIFRNFMPITVMKSDQIL